jgi:hypothetical protein
LQIAGSEWNKPPKTSGNPQTAKSDQTTALELLSPIARHAAAAVRSTESKAMATEVPSSSPVSPAEEAKTRSPKYMRAREAPVDPETVFEARFLAVAFVVCAGLMLVCGLLGGLARLISG